MEPTIFMKLAVALLLGVAVGLERESYEFQTDKTKRSGRGSLGIRSYALIALLGVLSGLVYTSHFLIFILIGTAFVGLLLAYYVIGSLQERDHGVTTELAILLNFLLAMFLGLDLLPVPLIVALTVVMILLLSRKAEIKGFVSRIRGHELDAFISFAIIALVILPFLPDTAVTLAHVPELMTLLAAFNLDVNRFAGMELLNPFSLWRVVVILTGVDLAGYFLERTVGSKKSWLLTSAAGGFISSTATTQSLAIRSRKTKNADALVAAAILANLTSFLQHAVLILSMSTTLLITGLPYLVSIIGAGTAATLFYYLKSRRSGGTDTETVTRQTASAKIFALKPAIQFAVLFTVIKLLSRISLALFGNGGFFLTAALASLTGLDAVTLSVGELAGGSITYQLGIMALLGANAINLLAKSVYSYMQGSRYFAVRFALSMVFIIVVSAFSVVFLV